MDHVKKLATTSLSPARKRKTTSSVTLVILWYVANSALVISNKALMGMFQYPVFLSMLHMVSCYLLGSARQRTTRQRGSPDTIKSFRPSSQRVGIVALSAVFCASIVTGNISLRFIHVTFAQALGSLTPAITAVFAGIILHERESALTYATLVPIIGGVLVSYKFEPQYSAVGCAMAVVSTSTRSLKSVLQGKLLKGHYDSMTLLDEMAPIAATMLFLSTVSIERVAPFSQAIRLGRSNRFFVFMLLCNSLLAYVVNVLNFALTHQTSPLTLQVLGNAKSVATSAASVAVFRNQVSPLSAIGFFVSVAGTLAYGVSKRSPRVRASPAKSTPLFSKSSGPVSSLV